MNKESSTAMRLYQRMTHFFMPNTVEILMALNNPFLFSPQVRAARNLLSAVTRLLILADMIDVHLLLKKLRRVEDDLEMVNHGPYKV